MPNSKKDVETLCIENGMRILTNAIDHPNVDEIYQRASNIDGDISIATVYRTVRLFEDVGIIERHDFGDGKSRYEPPSDEHHDHLINVETGEVLEFVNEEIEVLQEAIAKKMGFKLVDHRMELYAVPLDGE